MRWGYAQKQGISAGGIGAVHSWALEHENDNFRRLFDDDVGAW
jgi:hypothetical protein